MKNIVLETNKQRTKLKSLKDYIMNVCSSAYIYQQTLFVILILFTNVCDADDGTLCYLSSLLLYCSMENKFPFMQL